MDYKKICGLIFIAGIVFLVLVSVFNPNPLLFDEVLFPPNVLLMEKYGLSKKFLLEMKDQAPGPLYQFIHLPLKSITQLKAPVIRLVNPLFLLMSIFAISIVIKNTFRDPKYHSGLLALNFIAFPVIWQVTGLALTEMPAIFFATLSLLLLSLIVNTPEKYGTVKLSMISLASGISLGLAVLGRTPYIILVASVGLIYFLLDEQTIKRKALTVLPGVIIPIACLLPLILVWQGLVPPQQARVDGGLKIWHAILGLAYGAIITLFIAPKWFYFNRKILITLSVSFIVFFFYNYFIERSDYYPLSVTIEKYMPASIVDLYKLMVPALIGTLGSYYGIVSLMHLYEKRKNTLYVFCTVCTLLLLLSNAKISHQFSSRYIAQAVPFMLIGLVPFDEMSWHKALRTVFAFIVGFLSLNTYAEIF